MAYLQIGDQQFVLRAGAQRIAPDAAADIPIPGADASASAVVELGGDDHVVIRRASDDSVLSVNGVALGAEPAPLMHGDRVQIGGRELRFGEANQAGNTQFLSRSAVADVIRARGGAPSRPTSATGGRLVSLVDGRDYTIQPGGLVFGRDPAADVVVPAAEVSRRHARIAPADGGYVIADLSTNGVWVNGERVEKEQRLGRGDIIKIAAEEFRFYADITKQAAAEATPVPAAVAPAPPSVTPAPRSDAETAPPPTAVDRPDTAPEPASTGAPAATEPPPPASPVLAVLTVINAPPGGEQRLEIRSPLTNIGRGAYNDLVLDSPSVSDSHAKLQMREAGWVLQDVGSTNGTYIGGHRVEGEQTIVGAPDLRFGDIKVSFRALVEPAGAAGKATQAIAGVTLDQARRASERKQSAARQAPEIALPKADRVEERRAPVGGVVLLVGMIALAIWWFFLRGA